MSDIEYLELGILEFEKDLEDDCNNEWLKRVVAGMKKCYQRLEGIENANPSEALEELEKVIEEITIGNADLRNTLKTSVLITSIKQALIKSQDSEKALEIIFKKSLNIPIFKEFIRLRKPIDYMLKRFNQGREKKDQFTEEEFELLKEVLK